jgi:hypothetical protein
MSSGRGGSLLGRFSPGDLMLAVKMGRPLRVGNEFHPNQPTGAEMALNGAPVLV